MRTAISVRVILGVASAIVLSLAVAVAVTLGLGASEARAVGRAPVAPLVTQGPLRSAVVGEPLSAPLDSSVNPVPEVTGLSPSQAMVGDQTFTLTVVGNGFVDGCTVLWNGEARNTGYVGPTMVTASILGTDVASAGAARVTVSNPGPGGGESQDPWLFTIANPSPTVSALDPSEIWAGSGAFTLVVTGAHFTPTSVVHVAGVEQATTFVSDGRLEAQVDGSLVARAGPVSVRVYTPDPGGGLSAPIFLDVKDDNVPPVTTVSGLHGLWHRTTTVFTLVATDVGMGVEKTFYRIDGKGEYMIGTKVRIPAPANHSNDGMHVVQFFSIDKVLNWEQPPKEVQVGIDTRPPTTSIDAAVVRHGGSLRPHYLVYDALSPRARDALLQVFDAKRRLVRTWTLGRPVTRTWHTGGGFTVDLPPGIYTMRVLAHDLAGNAQSGTKSGVLTVT